MSQGVEWSVHVCIDLACADGSAIPTAQLAELHGLPAASVNKHLQQLARAGVIVSTPGPRGGFRLARPADQISYLDVVEAIEGSARAFRCTEIRQRGVFPASEEVCRVPCSVSSAMHRAEDAWRRELAAVSIADTLADLATRLPGVPENIRTWLRRPRS